MQTTSLNTLSFTEPNHEDSFVARYSLNMNKPSNDAQRNVYLIYLTIGQHDKN